MIVSAPAAPSNLVATVLPGSQIQLTWADHATNATSYSVERSTDGTTWNPIVSLGATSISYRDTGVIAGTTYFYRVRAFNGMTPSAYSNQVSATIATTVGAPAAPSNLVATALSWLKMRLTWTDHATNETGFSIERAVYNTQGTLSNYTPIATVGANVTSYIDNTVVVTRLYSYRIRAFNSYGTSAYSNATMT